MAGMLTLKAAKEGFFDREKILAAVDRARVRILSKFGAFVRTRAKTSIRKRKGSSPPAGPPYSHEGSLRRLITFGYDLSTKSAVVGPTLINRPTGAPAILEYGGATDISFQVFRRRSGKNVRVTKSRKVKIAQRPFMHPALEAELPKFPELWRDSVR